MNRIMLNDKIIVCILFTFFAVTLKAQDEEASCQTIDNKKAVKLYEQGLDKKNKKEERLAFLKEAINLEPDYVDANFAFAEERIKTLIYEDAAFKPTQPYFKKVIEICPNYHSDPYYYLGFIAYEESDWKEAVKNLKAFLNFKSDNDKKFNKNYEGFLTEAKLMLRYAKFYDEIVNHPVPFDPIPVAGICTDKDEYLPIISADDEQMLFTRKQPYANKNLVYETDKELELFSYSKRNPSTGMFDKGKRMPYPFNKNGSEGGATMSIDNKHLYFTICKDEGGPTVNCDIYYSDYIDGEWTEAKKVEGINDKERWDSQPTIASDGRTLYFASDRKGGRGGVDLYSTIKDPVTGVWSTPENMGPVINTPNDEKTPFIHSDFETIYFSSDGHPGVGGFDIFYSKKDTAGKWSEPKNIGVPINTKGDDLGFFVSTDGHLGYFASNEPFRTKGKSVGGFDIYSFDLYKEARPEEVAFFKGDIDDVAHGNKKGFTVEVKDAVTKKITEAVVDSTTGKYAVVVNNKAKNDLIITVKKKDYAFSSTLISKDSIKGSKPVKINMQVDSIKVGHAYTLNNIYFNTNSSVLEPRSIIVLDEFAEFLKVNPTIKIEINGHTDNVGNEQANLTLSTDRALSVRTQLIEKGVEEKRILNSKGFGSSKPIADNNTPSGRAANRRTEFLIVGK
jgi:outer membrane protein OmpA-like peptidoglycan-associated protein